MPFPERKETFSNAPLVPYFVTVVLCILFDRQVSPGVLFWYIILVALSILLIFSLLLRLLPPIFQYEDDNIEFASTKIFWGRFLRFLLSFIKNVEKNFLYGNICAWCIVGVVFGLRHEIFYNHYLINEIGLYTDEEGSYNLIDLRIKTTPLLKHYKNEDSPFQGTSERTSFIAEVNAVKNLERWKTFTGRVKVFVDGDATFLHIGDRVQCFGRIARVAKKWNPEDRDSYRDHRTQRILTSLNVAKIENITSIIENKKSFRIYWNSFFEKARITFGKILTENLSPRNAAVARGMTLGFRNDVDDETNEAFQRTGTVHLLAISGLHITLVVGAFVFFLRRLCLPVSFTAILTIALVLFYLFLTDVRTPVIRASVLIIVATVGTLLGRRGVTLNTLVFSALIILAINPCELFQLGSQLSFMATAVFLWSSNLTLLERTEQDRRKFETKSKVSMMNNTNSSVFFLGGTSKKNKKNQYFRNSLLRWFYRLVNSFFSELFSVGKTGFYVWSIGTPLILRTTNLFTPIALIANPLIWLPATIALFMAFLLLFIGILADVLPSIFEWIVPIVGNLTDWGFDCFLGMLDICASPSFGAFRVPTPPNWALWLFYIPLILWTLYPKFRPIKIYMFLGALVWINVLTLANFCNYHKDLQTNSMRVYIFSVGHGCAILGHLPDGRSFLYDCGSLSSSRHAAEIVAKNLWNEQKSHINLAIISHADFDHYGGFERLAELVTIDKVCVSPTMFKKKNRQLKKLQDMLQENNIPVETITRCDSLNYLGFPELFVLHPVLKEEERSTAVNEANPHSIVLGIEHEGRRILLPGDLDTMGVEFLYADPIPFDVVLAPHHGGVTSDYSDILEWAYPNWVVISGGMFTRSRKTEEQLRREGFQVLHTADDGRITIEVGRSNKTFELGKLHIQTYRSQKDVDTDLLVP